MLQQRLEALRERLRNLRPSPLEGRGERVDIDLSRPLPKHLNMYQLSHLRRYEFAERQIDTAWVVGDFACGTGYGSVVLARRAAHVVGGDVNGDVIDAVRERYAGNPNVAFDLVDLREFDAREYFDAIVSFETIEHFSEPDIGHILHGFARALKPGGLLVLSTPYMQENSPAAQALGFHHTFLIDEAKIDSWLMKADLEVVSFQYQNYSSHTVVPTLEIKDFIVCVGAKSSTHNGSS
jgi:2-polyprenyl-3-methyl-5-hydroxy-6-metoxy-1,4-benzoquinol methylase